MLQMSRLIMTKKRLFRLKLRRKIQLKTLILRKMTENLLSIKGYK